MKIQNNFSTINFTELRATYDALKRLAVLTDGDGVNDTQKAYNKLMQISNKNDIILLLDIYNDTGSKVSKLTPLTEDVIEISCNDDYTQGIEDAIDKLDTDSKSSDIFLFDTARQRILMQMKHK